MRNTAYWERRLRNLEENIKTEPDVERLEEELVNYVQCLIHLAFMVEIESYTYQLN